MNKSILADISDDGVQTAQRRTSLLPDNALRLSGLLWFLVAAIGQWIFVFYVAAYYIPILASQGIPGLGATHLPKGYVPGDMPGNIAIAAHLMIAIVIIGGGPLQLIPAIRNRAPVFHRYLGRTYMTFSVLTSIAGLYLVWTRGVLGGMAGHIAISLDGVLIIVFAAIAVRFAMKGEIDRHRRWAMRLFMVVSAVWFFRIGIMFWFATTGGVGIDAQSFQGPALTVLYFAQMAVPLAVLQVYFNAQDSTKAWPKFAAGLLVVVATGATAMGVFAAAMGMWFPNL